MKQTGDAVLGLYVIFFLLFSLLSPFPTPPGLASSPTTLYERYSSPAGNPTRRRLFVDNDTPTDSTRTPVRVSQQPVISTVPVQNVSPDTIPVTPVPGQTLVTVATATVTANNGQTVTIPVQGKEVLMLYLQQQSLNPLFHMHLCFRSLPSP